jgi:hypothetical protein
VKLRKSERRVVVRQTAAIIMFALLARLWTPASAASSQGVSRAPGMGSLTNSGNGIYGRTIVARGNLPARPPTYSCVTVRRLKAKIIFRAGACSGMWGSFRVPLPAGNYTVEIKGWPARTVKIEPGKWIDLTPPSLRQPHHGPRRE